MKEFDDDDAVAMMAEALNKPEVPRDSIFEVLDLIFDYYEENGELEIDCDDDSDSDIDAITDYVLKYAGGSPDCVFIRDDIDRMVRAEIAYEDSLL